MTGRKIILSTLLCAILLSSCSAITELSAIRKEENAERREARVKAKELVVKDVEVGIVRKGFSTREVIVAWGKPDRRSVSFLDHDIRLLRQWVYPERMSYVYFIGHKVCVVEPICGTDENY